MSARRDHGFTLIEVTIALGVVAAVLGIALGALRLGLAAWRQGEARAEHLQHARSLSAMLDHVVGGAYPYRVGAADAGGVVFEGEPERIGFVTTMPAVPLAAPIAFAATRLAHEDAGLAVRQGALPPERSSRGSLRSCAIPASRRFASATSAARMGAGTNAGAARTRGCSPRRWKSR